MNQLGFVLLCRKVGYKYSSSDAIIICRCVSLGKYAIRYDTKMMIHRESIGSVFLFLVFLPAKARTVPRFVHDNPYGKLLLYGAKNQYERMR